MLYLADNLQPLFRQWLFPADHLLEAAPAIKDNARIGIEKAGNILMRTSRHTARILLGEHFSLVDLYALVLMRWSRNMPKPDTTWPHLAELATRLKARPSWKRSARRKVWWSGLETPV